MIEQVINDGLSNIITLRYDDTTDTITVKNNGVDESFHEMYLNDAVDVIDKVITIEGTVGPEEWEGYTDNYGRDQLQIFWDTNKLDKETRGFV